MVDSLVKYELHFPSALIKLNRPDRRNALSRDLITSLHEAFVNARDNAAVRCVILTGEGSSFCAGMDLAELSASLEVPTEETPVWEDSRKLAELYDLIYTLPKPTIAAVNGPAVAGGAGLVSVCDLAVASTNAVFGYPEVRRGLVAAMVMPHLLRLVGERMARYLLLAGELIDAQEAVKCGLVNEVVSSVDLMASAERHARQLAEGGPMALGQTKDLLRQFSHQVLSLEEAAKASAAPRLTEECKQGLQAFFAKRPAPWVP